MPILCKNGTEHKHDTVLESKQCWGLVARPGPPPPVSYPRGYAAVDRVTNKQIQYAVDLGGDRRRVAAMLKDEASRYIKGLLNGSEPRVSTPKVGPYKGVDPTAEEVEPDEVATPKTTKTDMILALIDAVPDAYFAVQRAEGDRVYFIRVSRPKHGKMRGALKVQSQHGPALETRWVHWPSGSVSRYHWQYDIEDVLLLLVADWRGATMRYAEKIKKCGRCNTALTDPRSRFYGIGPECETKHGWGWWIDEIAEKKGGYWEQQPLEVQEKYRVDASGL
jgi:hypothetical protein